LTTEQFAWFLSTFSVLTLMPQDALSAAFGNGFAVAIKNQKKSL